MQVMLPYRTDWRSIMTMLDYVKGKGADRSSLEARLGSGESFRETLNAAEQLRLVERDEGGEIRLTRPGQRVAYAATEAERRRELAAALCSYPPYRLPLERAMYTDARVIDGPSVERIWQVDMRLAQPRNRVEEARTLFFRLADEAGLGSFRRGVRGQPTRLELDDDFGDVVRELLGESSSIGDADATPAGETAADAPTPVTGSSTVDLSLSPPVKPAGPSGVQLQIHVDMSEWDLDRIEAFLEMVGMRARPEHTDA